MKKLFGKRGIALLTTLALVISMVAMLGGLTASAEYSPKRTVTFTTSEGVTQSCLMLEDAFKVAAGKTVTIAGYYKVDSISGGTFELLGGVTKVTEATDGWVEFSLEYAVPTGAEWKHFGFWQAAGTFALADITFTDAEGNVVYDMATDADLAAGTYEFAKAGTPYDKKSIWYLLGIYGEAAAESTCTVVVDPVYEAPAEYTPKRVISMTTAGTQINGKIYLYNSNLLGEGKEVTVKGYYKVEDYKVANENQNPKIWVPGAEVTDNCDWTAFEVTGTTGTGKLLAIEFWYTQGTVSFADVIIEDANGNCIYDMSVDEDLVAGTYTADNWAINQGVWYFGFYSTIDQATYTVGDIYVPETYTPTRVMSYTAGGAQVNGKILITGSGTKLGEGKEVTVKGYYKVENFKALNKADNERIIIAGNIDVTEDCAWTPFEVAYTTGDSNWLAFEYWYAQGTLSIADITIEDADGKVIYDLISDEALVAGEYTADTWVLSQGMWYFGYYGEKSEISYTIGECIPAEDPCANGHTYIGGVCKFCGDEKEYPTIEGDPNYVPDRVMSIETFGGKNGAAGTAIEGKFLLTRGYFPGHSVVYIKGYYKIENYREAVTGSDNNVQIGAGGGCNPKDSYAAKGNTNGWVAFSIGFIPKSEDNTEWEGCGKFGHWYTHGKLSLADVTIESRDGEVLYDMRYDESLPTGTTAGGTGFLTEEEKGIQTDRWYIGAYGYDDWNDIEVVVTEALDKPAQTGDADIFFVVALGTMAAITLAVVTLNKKKFSV